jgi:hypothetical protein
LLRKLSFLRTWVHAGFLCFHNLVTCAQKLQDRYSACLMFWLHAHIGPRFIVSSENERSNIALLTIYNNDHNCLCQCYYVQS